MDTVQHYSMSDILNETNNTNVVEVETQQTLENKNVNNKPTISYTISREYWENQPATVNGMLGGYDFVSNPDVEQSQQFLDYFLSV